MKTNSLSTEIQQAMKKYPLFFQKVWTACAQIPAGTTKTYGELAAAVGVPGAARAVGTALSKNPFAPVVPCHRVIRSDGKMGGYSGPGGIATKRTMLHRERFAGRATK